MRGFALVVTVGFVFGFAKGAGLSVGQWWHRRRNRWRRVRWWWAHCPDCGGRGVWQVPGPYGDESDGCSACDGQGAVPWDRWLHLRRTTFTHDHFGRPRW